MVLPSPVVHPPHPPSPHPLTFAAAAAALGLYLGSGLVTSAMTSAVQCLPSQNPGPKEVFLDLEGFLG